MYYFLTVVTEILIKRVIIIFIAKAMIANWNQIESIYDMQQ